MESWYGDPDPWDNGWQTHTVTRYSVPVPKPTNPLESATDADLIFELLGRGYAVAKLPPEKLAENM